MSSLITTEESAFFADNGYLVLRGLLNTDGATRLREAIAEVVRGEDRGIRSRQTFTRDGTTSTQLQQVHRASGPVRQFLFASGLAEVAAVLMRTDEVRLWHDQVIFKDARRGGRVDWHQDYYYWQHLDRPGSVTAWTALTGTTTRNGCVWVVPGSHRDGILAGHGQDGFPFRYAAGDASPVAPFFGARRAVPLCLQPGDVSFHHCLTLHGSGENAAEEPRYGYTTHFLPSGVRYRRRFDTVREHEVEVADGERITGDGFPLLYTAKAPADPARGM